MVSDNNGLYLLSTENFQNLCINYGLYFVNTLESGDRPFLFCFWFEMNAVFNVAIIKLCIIDMVIFLGYYYVEYKRHLECIFFQLFSGKVLEDYEHRVLRTMRTKK